MKWTLVALGLALIAVAGYRPEPAPLGPERAEAAIGGCWSMCRPELTAWWTSTSGFFRTDHATALGLYALSGGGIPRPTGGYTTLYHCDIGYNKECPGYSSSPMGSCHGCDVVAHPYSVRYCYTGPYPPL